MDLLANKKLFENVKDIESFREAIVKFHGNYYEKSNKTQGIIPVAWFLGVDENCDIVWHFMPVQSFFQDEGTKKLARFFITETRRLLKEKNNVDIFFYGITTEAFVKHHDPDSPLPDRPLEEYEDVKEQFIFIGESKDLQFVEAFNVHYGFGIEKDTSLSREHRSDEPKEKGLHGVFSNIYFEQK